MSCFGKKAQANSPEKSGPPPEKVPPQDDAAKKETEALNQELLNLQKENQTLQKKVEEAEHRAADLEHRLSRLPSQIRRELVQPSQSGLSALGEKGAKSLERGLSAREGYSRAVSKEPLPLPSRQPSRKATRQYSSRPTPPLSRKTTFSKLPGEEDDEQQETEKEETQSRQSPSARNFSSVGRRKTETPTPDEGDKNEQAASPEGAPPLSKSSSLQLLKKALTRSFSQADEKKEKGPYAGEVPRVGSSEWRQKLEAQTREKEALEAELKALLSRCNALEVEIREAKEKRKALRAKVRNMVQKTALRVDILQTKYEAAVKQVADDHKKAQQERLFYYGRRKGLELRIAALLDKVYALENAEPVPPKMHRHATRFTQRALSPSSNAEDGETAEDEGPPQIRYLYSRVEGGPDGVRENATAPPQIFLFPAHFFDETAMKKSQDRADAAARRLQTVALPNHFFAHEDSQKGQGAFDRLNTVPVPCYLFDESSFAPGSQSPPAGELKSRLQTVLIPRHLFNEEAALRAQERNLKGAKRVGTIALPSYLFDEPEAQRTEDGEDRMSQPSPTPPIPSDMFREGSVSSYRSVSAVPEQKRGEPSADHQLSEQSSRQSTLFPRNLFGNATPQKEPPDAAAEGPAVADAEHENRKSLPVNSPETDELVFPELGSQAAGSPRRQKEKVPTSQTQEPAGREQIAKEAPKDARTRGSSPPRHLETYINAPCCGRSTRKSDVRPFRRCGCLICRHCLKIASMQSKVHINNFVGTDPRTGAPIWKVRCPTCGLVAPLTPTQLRTASIKQNTT